MHGGRVRTPKPYTSADKVTTWKVRFRDQNQRNTSETFPDEAAAIAFAQLLDLVGPAAAVALTYANRPTKDTPDVAQLGRDQIAHLTGIEDGTRDEYLSLWERTWVPLIGGLPVMDEFVTKDAVADAVNELVKRYSRKSLENQRGMLSAVLDRGVELGLLTKNVARGIALPIVAGDGEDDDDDDEDPIQDMHLLTVEEFGILEKQFTYKPYLVMVRFMVGTGCRWGETVVLRKRDFNLRIANPAVRIRRALKRHRSGKIIIKGPKTKKSRRTVTLPRELIPELIELMANMGENDIVFQTPTGGMIRHSNWWQYQWRPAVIRARRCANHTEASCRCAGGRKSRCKVHPGNQLPPACGCAGTISITPRIHDLRHTHASWLLAAGVPVHVVQARLGHKSIQTTVDTYGHLLPDAQLAAAAAAAAVFAELDAAAQEQVIQRELAGLDLLLSFLAGDDELPAAVVAALKARGWSQPVLELEPSRD